MKYIISFIIGIFITLSCMKLLPAPYFWAGCSWFVILTGLLFTEKKSFRKAVFFNVMVVILLLTAAEFYFWKPYTTKVKSEGNMWQQSQYVKDDIRGYMPPKNATQIFGKKYFGNSIMYDMQFSTNEHGLRSTPIKVNADQAALFFGCSVTFGDGLNDEQTLPYIVGIRSGGNLATFNLAYSGYGPHQMLSLLEHGLVKSIVPLRPKYAFYSAIPGHILRSAGLQSWIVTWHDPKYEIDEQGKVYNGGHFDDQRDSQVTLKQRLRAHLSNSYILKKIYLPFGYNIKRLQNAQDLEKYIKIVAKARDVFEQQYPGAEFHIILWELLDSVNNQDVYNQIVAGFKKNNLRIHYIKDILPKFYQNNPYYQIVHDGHPTPYANEIIADYILREIIHS